MTIFEPLWYSALESLDGSVNIPAWSDHIIVPSAMTVISKDGHDFLVDQPTLEHRASGESVFVHSTLNVQPKPRMLADFITLGFAPAERIAAYARTWGNLGLCNDGLPYGGHPGFWYAPVIPFHNHSPECLLRPIPETNYLVYEPLDWWRRYARQAKAMLEIASALHKGTLGQDADWRSLFDGEPLPSGYGHYQGNGTMLTLSVEAWLGQGIVVPHFQWRGPETTISLYHQNQLFGALTVQLVMAVARALGRWRCSVCDEPYTPNRRPRDGENHYCNRCRKLEGNRIRAQRYRNRRKEASNGQEEST